MANLIQDYIEQHRDSYIKKLIADSRLSPETRSTLLESNILSFYDLLTASEDRLETVFKNCRNGLEEIEDFIFYIQSDIIDDLDSFPELEEWNMFLDAVNDVMSIDPLKCSLCFENPSAYSINIANERYINICENCAGKIKVQILDLLINKGLC